jgi:hypothetical protein
MSWLNDQACNQRAREKAAAKNQIVKIMKNRKKLSLCGCPQCGQNHALKPGVLPQAGQSIYGNCLLFIVPRLNQFSLALSTANGLQARVFIHG